MIQSAVPTIDIWRLTTVENEQNNSSTTPSTSNICQKDTLNVSERATIASPVSSNESTPGKQKLKVMIQDKEYVITKQRKQIKKIQTQNRRLKKKIKQLEDALRELQEKYLKQTEEVSTLKNTLQKTG
ncbi:unnamed protein product [Parnassius apollo]|uniref:(apollo) hypothetical protein n=1 Tax=Parnassius apollo TaxID=110799 RepID=A0A8S3W762_PARAO|nr:unnamed protein product [Parnassius apollo]